MKKLFVILGIIILIIVIGAGALFFVVKSYLTPEKVSALISEKLESAIHHKVKLGTITTGLSSADIAGVTLLPNNPHDTIPLAQIKKVSLTFSLFPLFHKKLEIGEILIDTPKVYMVREKDGTLNWQKEFAHASIKPGGKAPHGWTRNFSLVSTAMAADTKPAPRGFVIHVREIEIHHGTLKWVDRTLAPDYKATLAPLEIELKNFSLNKPFDFDLKGVLRREKESRFTAKGTLNLKKRDLKGKLILKSLYLPDISPYLKGTGIQALSGTGNLDLKVATRHFDAWEIEQTLDLSSIVLKVQNRTSQKIDARFVTKGEVNLKKGQLTLKTLEGKILDSDFKVTGNLSDLKSTPKGSFQFTSNRLDVNMLLGLAGIISGPSSKGEKRHQQPPVPSKGKAAPAPMKNRRKTASLKTLPSLTIHANIHLLTIQKMQIKEIHTKVVTHGSMIILDPLTADVYGGTVQGKVVVDLRKGIPEIKKEISLKNVAIAPLLADIKPGMKERFTGRFFGNAKGRGILGVPSSYLGDVTFHVEDGSIQRLPMLQIAAAIMKLPSLANLHFNTLKGVLHVENRVIHILTVDAKGRDLLFHTDGAIKFDKAVNLKTRLELPYRVVRKGLGKRSDLFADRIDKERRKWSIIPIKIKGTTDHPRVSIVFQKETVEKIIEKNIHDKRIKKFLKKLFR